MSNSYKRGGRGSRGYNKNRRMNDQPQMHNNEVTDLHKGIYKNERFVFHATSLIGSVARLTVSEKNARKVYEGIFKTFDFNFEVVLEKVHEVNLQNPEQIPCKDEVSPSMIFKRDDIITIVFINADPNYAVTDNFTDSAISSRRSNGQPVEKVLQPWVCDSQADEMELLEDGGQNGWDPREMFKTNKDKFNIGSTYDPNLSQYTTPLPTHKTEDFQAFVEKAKVVAREIESSSGYQNQIELENTKDEETLHSAVIRDPPVTTASMTPPSALANPSSSLKGGFMNKGDHFKMISGGGSLVYSPSSVAVNGVSSPTTPTSRSLPVTSSSSSVSNRASALLNSNSARPNNVPPTQSNNSSFKSVSAILTPLTSANPSAQSNESYAGQKLPSAFPNKTSFISNKLPSSSPPSSSSPHLSSTTISTTSSPLPSTSSLSSSSIEKNKLTFQDYHTHHSQRHKNHLQNQQIAAKTNQQNFSTNRQHKPPSENKDFPFKPGPSFGPNNHEELFIFQNNFKLHTSTSKPQQHLSDVPAVPPSSSQNPLLSGAPHTTAVVTIGQSNLPLETLSNLSLNPSTSSSTTSTTSFSSATASLSVQTMTSASNKDESEEKKKTSTHNLNPNANEFKPRTAMAQQEPTPNLPHLIPNQIQKLGSQPPPLQHQFVSQGVPNMGSVTSPPIMISGHHVPQMLTPNQFIICSQPTSTQKMPNLKRVPARSNTDLVATPAANVMAGTPLISQNHVPFFASQALTQYQPVRVVVPGSFLISSDPTQVGPNQMLVQATMVPHMGHPNQFMQAGILQPQQQQQILAQQQQQQQQVNQANNGNGGGSGAPTPVHYSHMQQQQHNPHPIYTHTPSNIAFQQQINLQHHQQQQQQQQQHPQQQQQPPQPGNNNFQQHMVYMTHQLPAAHIPQQQQPQQPNNFPATMQFQQNPIFHQILSNQHQQQQHQQQQQQHQQQQQQSQQQPQQPPQPPQQPHQQHQIPHIYSLTQNNLFYSYQQG